MNSRGDREPKRECGCTMLRSPSSCRLCNISRCCATIRFDQSCDPPACPDDARDYAAAIVSFVEIKTAPVEPHRIA